MATILVVEDNEPSRDVLSRRLERRGYRVLHTKPVRFQPWLGKIESLVPKAVIG
jgi:CheY-like chemotaxis protein